MHVPQGRSYVSLCPSQVCHNGSILGTSGILRSSPGTPVMVGASGLLIPLPQPPEIVEALSAEITALVGSSKSPHYVSCPHHPEDIHNLSMWPSCDLCSPELGACPSSSFNTFSLLLPLHMTLHWSALCMCQDSMWHPWREVTGAL